MLRIDFSKTHSESYQFYGNEAVSIDLNQGDLLKITDIEGSQPCLIQAFDKSKQPSLNLIQSEHKSLTQQAITELPDVVATSLQQELDKHNIPNISATNFSAASIFQENSISGTTVDFTVQADCICLLIGLTGDMLVDQQNPPTALQLEVVRNTPSETPKLPYPIGITNQDFRIPHSSARSFKVAKGEYIQIIDVEGRQCSDFQCFAVSDLEKNQEYSIDPTVTRSFMGSVYPTPGAFSKYYNQDSQPLVEIIQDMVFRHDTFGLACNSKYYEDRGYFGHPNCTDNFNDVLADFSITPRKNWQTINLFFNTHVEECSSLSLDIPWSRPGDHVLFKALTDLVCVASACPDDIDRANNWNPTDIHVRVYEKSFNINQAKAFRPTPDAIPRMTKETGFHAKFAQHTRNFIDYNGYWLANNFTNYGAIKEYWACREKVAVMDLSPLRKYEVIGEDAETLLQLALTRNVRRLTVGQVVYSAICYENGGMMDDGTLFRLCQNNFRWIGGCESSGNWLRKLAEQRQLDVRVKSSTDQLHNIAVQGPHSRDVIRKFLWTVTLQPTIDELGWFRFTIGRIEHEQGIPIMISRTGYTGELGYEIWCHPKDAPSVWQTVWDAGSEYGIAPLGLEALDMLRIESGLIFADYEFNDQTDPIEAGIGFTVPLKTKEDDFIGREAIARRKENPINRLVGLELSGSEIALHGDGVYIGKQQVGVITSATRSPILKKNIALCRMSVTHAEIGTSVEVGKLDGEQKRLPAKVIAFPFYDPDKSRVRA